MTEIDQDEEIIILNIEIGNIRKVIKEAQTCIRKSLVIEKAMKRALEQLQKNEK